MNLKCQSHIPTRDAIARASDELELMTERLAKMETALEPIILSRADENAVAARTALQEIDILMQSNAALAGFLRKLGQIEGREPDEVLTEALANFTLRDMAARLGGQHGTDAQNSSMELF